MAIRVDDWTTRAACKGMPVGVFFPTGTGPASTKEARKAKAVCRGCRVRRECLAEAIADKDFHGIRGGMTGRERASLVRRR